MKVKSFGSSGTGRKDDMNKRRRILFLFILAGLLILNYPFVSQWLNRRNESRVIRTYEQSMEKTDDRTRAEMRRQAEEYNQAIAQRQEKLTDAFSSDSAEDEAYQKVLNPGGDGIMGYVEIPSIEVTLPVYHGTDAEALENGAGHLYGSSLPIGGMDTHTVLSSHRGLPEKALFTDLDQLEKGDVFFLQVLGEKLAYQVDRIDTVEPEDTEALAVIPGGDYATLVTCTPYGINSHRLLVRGVRTDWTEETAEAEPERPEALGFYKILRIFAMVSVLLVLLAAWLLLIPKKKK